MSDDEIQTPSPNSEPESDPSPRPNPRPAAPRGDRAEQARPNPRPERVRRQAGPRKARARKSTPPVSSPGSGEPQPDRIRRPEHTNPTMAVEVADVEADELVTTLTRPLGDRQEVAAPTGAVSVFALEDDADDPAMYVDLDDPGEWTKLPRRTGWLRRFTVVAVILGLLAIVAGVRVNSWLHSQIHPAGPHGDPVEFTIEQGQATNAVANALDSKNIIGNATVFRYWLRRQGGDQIFRAGDYDLFESMDYPELLDILQAGPKPPVQIKATIPPGLTVGQMAVVLLDTMPEFDRLEMLQAFGNSRLESKWGGGGNQEGLLFPDTYNIDEKSAADEEALLRRMRDQMDLVLGELNAEVRAEELGYSVYEILTIASLIEEEALLDSDRPKIARVIYNRLAIGEKLGVDASTRYAVQKVNGEPLTVTDLDFDSPYNTRKNPGIPPTPIAAPGRSSIEAALNPTPNQPWLFYVLTDEGGVKGAHTFATTNAEFNAAVGVCRSLGYCD